MKNSAMEDAREGTLVSAPPPRALEARLIAFVHRDEEAAGVVRLFAEPRASITVMTAAPYWLREAGEHSPWRRTPRVALWAPSFTWRYGYARGRISAFAVGLTPDGLLALTGLPASTMINTVLALENFAPALAASIDVRASESFADWRRRAASLLEAHFASAPSPGMNFAPALEMLATSDGGAVARAAASAGLSERQFRRVFEEQFGVSPKRYQRVLRVDRMIRRLHPAPWEDDAHSGEPPFADQPHAIREFRAMTGMTPSAYAKAKLSGGRTLRSVRAEGVAPPNDGDDDAARC